MGQAAGTDVNKEKKMEKRVSRRNRGNVRDARDTAVGMGKELGGGFGKRKTQLAMAKRCVYTNPRDLRNG